MKNNPTRLVRFTLPAMLLTGALLYAGPLNPPAGPITGTGKTLTEVEPRIAINSTNTPGDADSLFKITQPGSYYLTGNISGVVGRSGLKIQADGVTVDLNGFKLIGVAGSLDGVNIPNVQRSVTVRNGTIADWGGDGVNGAFSLVLGEFENLNVLNCGGSAISINDIGVVRHCNVYNNATGITVGSRTLITGCTATFNSSTGIAMGHASTVIDCVVGNNTGRGIIALGGGGAILDSTVFGNGNEGINADTRMTVARCTVTVNSLHGIVLGTGCVAKDNTCAFNGNFGFGAGINVIGSDNRIEGNTCTTADRGIDVDAAGNIIIKNTCTGNTTNWDIVANNIYGPIIDRSAPASPAVLGNAAASTLATTDPNANFTY
ncbi:MAG: right-handed parallel beta-helix repeat-containing protein [Phycisphaerales bacterium]|nr:MAG: right-handed parallel beta-helix repeat-containing protein [Phycisphaerales bacterium]